MDYNKLKTFVVVANYGNISKAAQKLLRTQPAITFQIKELEEDLGITLFHREKARINLTKEGEKLYKVAKETLSGLDSFVADLKGRPEDPEGEIKIGVVPEYGREVFSRNLTSYRKNNPMVDIHLLFRPSEGLSERLLKNEIDVAIVARVDKKKGVKIKKLVDLEFQLVSSPKYLKEVKKIGLKNFTDLELVDYRSDFSLMSPWVKKNMKGAYGQIKHSTPHVIIEDYRGIRNYLVSGRGLAVLPVYTIAEDLKSGRLVQVKKSQSNIKTPLYLIHREQKIKV